MLEGMDKDFSPVVKETSVTYPDLQAGDYIFKVISCNNDGVWNKQPVTFSFTVKPPFWKTTWFYILVGILILVIFFAYVKFKERKLRKANLLLEQKVKERTEEVVKQKEEIEKKNEVITDSIEYAKNIQQAILPTDDYINKLLKNHFILYLPKDIVSGDFYWVDEDDNRALIAVSDCTGHGVPGAFVSLMGHNLLNETLNEKPNLKPSEILEILNQKILAALNQGKDEHSAKYGMDMALITIDKKRKTLEYSGAHNPLIVCRNGELIEIKGNKFSIGSVSKEDKLGFTNQVFDLKEGDMLYMFSDGYTDQKGGPENKKFFARPFRDLLLSVSKLDIASQRKQLDETIIKWRGSRDQTDDILVVGIKI